MVSPLKWLRAGVAGAKRPPPTAIIVALTITVIVVLSLWYLVQPQPLLVQGEADATRIDIAARVDGRVAERPVAAARTSARARCWSRSTIPSC